MSCILFPLVIGIILYRLNNDFMIDKDTSEKFKNSIYSDINLSSPNSVLKRLYFPMFIVKRFVIPMIPMVLK